MILAILPFAPFFCFACSFLLFFTDQSRTRNYWNHLRMLLCNRCPLLCHIFTLLLCVRTRLLCHLRSPIHLLHVLLQTSFSYSVHYLPIQVSKIIGQMTKIFMVGTITTFVPHALRNMHFSGGQKMFLSLFSIKMLSKEVFRS